MRGSHRLSTVLVGMGLACALAACGSAGSGTSGGDPRAQAVLSELKQFSGWLEATPSALTGNLTLTVK